MLNKLLLLLFMSLTLLIEIVLVFFLLFLNHLFLFIVILLFTCLLVMSDVSLILNSLFLKLSVHFFSESAHVLTNSFFNFLVDQVSYSFSHVEWDVLQFFLVFLCKILGFHYFKDIIIYEIFSKIRN